MSSNILAVNLTWSASALSYLSETSMDRSVYGHLVTEIKSLMIGSAFILQKLYRYRLPGKWYIHFASCFYIDIYRIMDCSFTLCHNTYGYFLLFYKVYIKRENAGSWNSGLEKEQILETYSAQLQKSWNSTERLKRNKEKSTPKMKARGPTPYSRGWGAPL